MATLTIPATSVQYVQQQVSYILAGASADPTSYPVQMAFVPQPASGGSPPDPSSWNAAAWETDPGPSYWAGCLIGTTSDGGVVLAKGTYLIAVTITTPVEVPVLWGWWLQIT